MSSTREDENTLSGRLIKEIGDYGISDTLPPLSPESKHELYRDCAAYRSKHDALIQRYKKKHPNSKFIPTNGNNEHFFRECLINYISKIISSKEPHYSNPDKGKSRSTNPESATVTLLAFLKDEGKELYKLALQEESLSPAFRESVLKNSTKYFEGQTWDTKPIITMIGPSSSGKTKTAYLAIDNADPFLPKRDGNGNTVVFVDGGIVRETSQIRKLAIQAANANGYSGIIDLHDESKALENIKTRIRKTAVHTPYGMIIPETFASIGVRGGKYLLAFSRAFKKLFTIPNSTPIFCHIKGKDPAKFKKVVGYLGPRRAFKTKFDDTTDSTIHISLNIPSDEICESKVYEPEYFSYGVKGSSNAEHLFKKWYPHNLRFTLFNDLIFVKQNPESKEWEPAEQTDADVVLVSEKHLEWWQSLTRTTQQESDQYDPDIPFNVVQAWEELLVKTKFSPPALEDFIKVVPSQIKTLQEIKLDNYISQIDRHIDKLNFVREKLSDKHRTSEMLALSNNVITPFMTISQMLKSIDPRNKQHLRSAMHQIQSFKEKHFEGLPSSYLKRLFIKIFKSRAVYLEKKSRNVLENAAPVLDNLLFSLVTKNKTDNNTSTAPTLAFKATGLLKEAKRKQLTDFLHAQTELNINNTPERIDVVYTQNPQKGFAITDQSILTTHKDAMLFKKMVETYLASNPSNKRMRVYAQDQDVKNMMEVIFKDLNIEPTRYRIEMPAALSTAPTLFSPGNVGAPSSISAPAAKPPTIKSS